MMPRFFFLTLFILLSAAFAGCGGLTETDTAVPLEVIAGETFDIVIEANPTTGFEWRLTEALDESVVQFVAQEYEADRPIAEGSGGMDVWTFQAVAPGTSQIILGHFPPDGSDTPNETAIFTVIVK